MNKAIKLIKTKNFLNGLNAKVGLGQKNNPALSLGYLSY
jgi:hypothetical protein